MIHAQERRLEAGMGRFLALWFGQTVSIVGSSLTGFALGVWVYQMTGAVSDFALVLLSNTLPGLLAAPWAGALSDRFNRRTVMLLSDCLAGLSTLILALLLAGGNLGIWAIALANAANAMARACQWPAYAASLPQLVPPRHLGRANGLIQLSQACGQLVAPLLGGALLGAIDIAGIFLIDLGTFVFALAILALLRFPGAPAAPTGAAPSARSLLGDALAGWRALARQPGLVALAGLMMFSNFSAGSIEVLITPLVLSFATPARLGLLMTVGGLGMVAGSLALSLWGGPRRLALGMLACEFLGACAMLLAGMPPNFGLLLGAAALYFFALPLGTGFHYSLLQRRVDPALHGRAFALMSAGASLALVLGYAGAGPLADRLFEPWLAPGGALEPYFAPWFGSGPGRGIGLLFLTMGGLTVLAVAAALSAQRVRRLDDAAPPINE